MRGWREMVRNRQVEREGEVKASGEGACKVGWKKRRVRCGKVEME